MASLLFIFIFSLVDALNTMAKISRYLVRLLNMLINQKDAASLADAVIVRSISMKGVSFGRSEVYKGVKR